MRRLREKRLRVARAVGSEVGILAPVNRLPRSKRTRELLELVQILQEIERVEVGLKEVQKQTSQNRKRGTLDAFAPIHMYTNANHILSACRWSPRISHSRSRPNSFAWNAKTEKVDWENGFVFWILNLRASGEISLIRCCRNCGKWFYSVTSHQRYCSDRCRQQFHSKDKNFKDQRRLYMRRYRKDQRAQDKAAAENVRRGGRGQASRR